jgi:hypothetical protein
MESLPRRIAPAWPLLAGLLACVIPGAGVPAQAQTQPPAPGQAQPANRPEGAQPDARPAARPDSGAKPTGEPARKEAAQAKAKARAQAPRREPSEEYKESIRKTVERRRQRRARRAQGQGPDDPRPVGAIVPWPMPPALIIRQTPEVHGEVGSLLGGLKRGG